MKEPSMKWMMISIIVGVAVFLLAFQSYNTFLISNNKAMSENYSYIYGNFTQYQNTYQQWGEEITLADIFNIPSQLLSTFVTAVSMGASLVGNLLNTLLGAKDIIRMLQEQFTEFSGVGSMLTLLLTVFSVWLVYRALAEARGVQSN